MSVAGVRTIAILGSVLLAIVAWILWTVLFWDGRMLFVE